MRTHTFLPYTTRFRSNSVGRGGRRARLIQFLGAIASASGLAVGAASNAAFDRSGEPELANRTRLIGSIVRTELQRTLELGIPLEAIAGLDRYLAETLSKFQAVERIVVTTAAGEEVAVVEHPESERSALEDAGLGRSEEHTSELQSLMRISYAV